jgi:serine/threonine protein kinase
MALAVGTRIGAYEVLSLVGVGGMGEVYKARDTRLDRVVAIKVLPAEAAERTDRRSRFEAEARAISALGHPHICTLFDVGDHEGRAFLVMEYLEGETVEDRLTRGALPVAQAIGVAAEIADALDHAHRHRIVHRDVKPSNVMLTPAGAKLLDFGLAKSPVSTDVLRASSTASLQGALTEEGTLVGTVRYMAPEQLEGKPTDVRTDVFALGVLLYEMASGEKAFEGDSQASLIASVLTARPPSLASLLSPRGDDSILALDHVVERCLARNPDDRWQTMRDVRLELEWVAQGGRSRPSRVFRWNLRPREVVAWSLAMLALVVAGLAVLSSRRATVEPTRFIVETPPGTVVPVPESRTRIAISPDGRRLALVVSSKGTQQIWIRSLDSVELAPLPGSEGAISPFWSPDGQFVGFFSPGEAALKKVDMAGGPARVICAAQADGVATWGPDGTILFTQFLDGIYRVSADGGTPVQVTRLDKSRRELNHYWPQLLPDGRRFIYMATSLDAGGLRETPGVYLASLDSRERTLLTRTHSRMVYAAPGHLLFVQDGALLAQKFDAASATLSGEPVRVADGVGYVRAVGNGAFTVSANGVLAYQGSGDPSRILWSDRRGAVSDTGWPVQNYGTLRFSRDGQRVAVDVIDPRTGAADIWLFDASRGTPVRVTSDAADESGPVWSPDDSRILLSTERGGPSSLRMGSAAPNVYVKSFDTGHVELLIPDSSPIRADDWSGDGQWVAYNKGTRQTGSDIWMMPAGGGKPEPFSADRFDEWGASFSPDSRWVAFASNEAGPANVYVAPVREPRRRTRISTEGGTTPRWRQDGRELVYASLDNRTIISVSVEPGPVFTAGPPRRLFSLGLSPAARTLRRNVVYDVSPDGQRFLISVPADTVSLPITVVLDWTADLVD